MMRTLQIDVPDEILVSLKETPESLAEEVRMAAAVKLFEIGKLSSGLAARLADVTRVEFLSSLGKYQVSPFQMTKEELERDVENA